MDPEAEYRFVEVDCHTWNPCDRAEMFENYALEEVVHCGSGYLCETDHRDQLSADDGLAAQ